MGSSRSTLLGKGVGNATASNRRGAEEAGSRQVSSTELRIDAARDRRRSEPDSVDIPVAELKALAQKNHLATGKWFTRKRAFVLLAVSLAAALLGAGALLASDGPRTSLLGWLSSMSSVSSVQTPTEAEPTAQALPSAAQPADATIVLPVPETAPSTAIQAMQEPATSAGYSQLERRIEALAQSLSALQEKIEQLGATQQRTVLEIARLRELEQDFRKLQSAPTANAVPIPPRKKASTLAPPPPAAALPPEPLPPATNLVPENPAPEQKPAAPSLGARLLGLIPRLPFQRDQ